MANFKKKPNGGNRTTSKMAPPTRGAGRQDGATRTTGFNSTSTLEGKPTEITRQQIAEQAYFLWKQRGGSEVSNWLEAERLLKSRAAANRR